MQIVWTSAAVIDLKQISDYIFEKNPRLAATTIRRILESASELKLFSRLGRNRPQRRYAGIGFNATALPSCLSSWRAERHGTAGLTRGSQMA